MKNPTSRGHFGDVYFDDKLLKFDDPKTGRNGKSLTVRHDPVNTVYNRDSCRPGWNPPVQAPGRNPPSQAPGGTTKIGHLQGLYNAVTKCSGRIKSVGKV